MLWFDLSLDPSKTIQIAACSAQMYPELKSSFSPDPFWTNPVLYSFVMMSLEN